MGALAFVTTAHGRNVEEAFNNAAEKARWDHGHSGYTGTIAEKPSAIHFPLPVNYTRDQIEALPAVLENWWAASATNDYVHSTDEERTKARAEMQELRAQYPGLNLTRLAAQWADKWEAAVAFRLPRETGQLEPDEWLFCGLASS